MTSQPTRPGLSAEAVLTLVLLGVFAAIALWLINNLGREERVLPALSSYSAQPDGTLALYELLEREGFSPQRFGDTEYEYPPESCVVLAEGPSVSFGALLAPPVNPKAVIRWVRDGGHLVLAGTPEQAGYQGILAEMNLAAPLPEPDGPDPTAADDGAAAAPPVVLDEDATKDIPPEVTAEFTGDGRAGRPSALSRLYLPGQIYQLPADRPPLWRDVATIETAGSTNTFISWRSDALLGAGSPPEAVVVYRQVGQGAVYLVPALELFTNDWLKRADNHRLVLALLAEASQGRTLYFDEHVHGFARQQHNALSLLLKTRGGHLLLLLTAAVLLFLAGAAVKPARAAREPLPARRQAQEMVLAQADLYQRAFAAESAARWIVDGLRQRVMQGLHLAHPPESAQLAQWAGELPPSYARSARVLLAYLADGRLPATGQAQALTKLAQAVQQLKRALG